MGTFHIHIKGRVQGVGFRPFVYQLAKAKKLKGWVCNSTDGVHVVINSQREIAKQFHERCISDHPDLAIVSSSTFRTVKDEDFEDFRIVDSKNTELALNISPDFAVCQHCLNEMTTTVDRRFLYPFITCTHCGPRFSILQGLPYDRPYTSMGTFAMCETCKTEYNNPVDRRYYSQTNSCGECGIKLKLESADRTLSNDHNQRDILRLTVEALVNDHIVAVKGIGGYLLLCNANSSPAITTLRLRKQRSAKPFAVLFPDLNSVEQHLVIGDEEKKSLNSPVAPIAVLQVKRETKLPIEHIAPGLNQIGAMLPYAPLLALISNQLKNPLVATSANVSGAPIRYEDDDSALFQLADFILSHNRPITFPQDDSVIRFSPHYQHRIILRRSRGLAPSTLCDILGHNSIALALGAEMKGTFALSGKSNTYVSQYLGNLGQYDNQVVFEKVLEDFMALVKVRPELIAFDVHSGYFTHQLGKKMASKIGIPSIEIQHHEAHFAAILEERQLIDGDKIMGVVWDGTGYGTDGHIWGGEFFEYVSHEIKRFAHLNYYSNLSGDRMAKDNRLCALSLVVEHDRHLLKPYFTQLEWEYYEKLIQSQSGVMTSSMGRLFDAVAFLSGAASENSYEGQSAMLLEQLARKELFEIEQVTPYEFHYDGNIISMAITFEEIMNDRKNKKSGIAARFHLTLIELVKRIAQINGFKRIALTGGVFQNGLLVDLFLSKMGDDFDLYFHQDLSPNDENISYGQLAYLKLLEKKQNLNPKNMEQCA